MFTSTTGTSGTTKPRHDTKARLPLFAAGAILLAAGATAGLAARLGGRGTHHGNLAQPAAAVRSTGGNLSQSATRGGGGDSRQFQSAAGVANALPPIPRGGYGESLQARAAGGTTGNVLSPRPIGGYAEWLLWRSEAGQSAAQ